MHSRHSSDGTFRVQELFKQAKENQMQVIVIADHDTYEGYDEICEMSEQTGIRTISAIELSCIDEERMVHILGYGINTKERHKLSGYVEKIQGSRIGILPAIRENLEREGFYVDMERIWELAYPHPPVITNFAQAVLQDERNKNNPELFPYRKGSDKAGNPYIHFIKDYLVAGRKCYVPEYVIDIYHGIQAIREAGGVPILAHPGEWFTKREEYKINRMVQCGLQGIEVYTPYHSAEKERYFEALTDQYTLLKTGGSDYHDIRKKPGHVMGMISRADIEMFEDLQNRAEANRKCVYDAGEKRLEKQDFTVDEKE